MLMQSEGKKTVQIQLQFIILGFNAPGEVPPSSATSQLPALPHSINLMLGG